MTRAEEVELIAKLRARAKQKTRASMHVTDYEPRSASNLELANKLDAEASALEDRADRLSHESIRKKNLQRKLHVCYRCGTPVMASTTPYGILKGCLILQLMLGTERQVRRYCPACTGIVWSNL